MSFPVSSTQRWAPTVTAENILACGMKENQFVQRALVKNNPQERRMHLYVSELQSESEAGALGRRRHFKTALSERGGGRGVGGERSALCERGGGRGVGGERSALCERGGGRGVGGERSALCARSLSSPTGTSACSKPSLSLGPT